MAVEVRIDPVALARYVESENGPIFRKLVVIGEAVRVAAKDKCGYDTDPDRDPSLPHIRDTIVKRIVRTARGFAVRVGTDHPIALLHHEGTRPHTIVPRTAKVLRFKSGGASVHIFRPRVQHPGTKPNRFLTDALRAVRSVI